MTAPIWIMLRSDGHWDVGVFGADGCSHTTVPVPNGASVEESVDCVVTHVRDLSLGDELIVCVDSPRILAACFPFASSRRRPDREAIAYGFEEFLPLDIEDVICDFSIGRSHVFGVGIETSSVGSYLETIEERGVRVRSLIPLAIISSQHLLLEHSLMTNSTILWGCDDRVEILTTEDGKIQSWTSMTADPRNVVRNLTIGGLSQDRPSNLVACDMPQGLMDDIERIAGIHVDVCLALPMREAATRLGHRILGGDATPCIELRRGRLAVADRYYSLTKQIKATVMTTVVLLMSLCVAFLIRARKYDLLTDHYKSEQQLVFRQALPDHRIQGGFLRRMESEYARLAGVRGTAENVQPRGASLVALRTLLESLPPRKELRLRMLELRIDGPSVFFDGELVRHGDADALAKAMRANGFLVEPPRTEQLENVGVAVQISAKLYTDGANTPE